ncbi:MAG: LysR family transcriptional regulator [Enterococcus sp.]
MEIRLLRYFWTVAQEGNITKAARVLNITQPTLSRQIKELEETVGTMLFQRVKNHLVLTQDGVFLKERAEEILQLSDKLEADIFTKKNQQLAGNFTVGCVEADNSDTLAMMIEELINDYPEVTFDLVTGTSEDISDKLEKGLLDFALLLEPVSLNDVESLRLPREEKWGILMSNEFFLANQEVMTPEDIKGLSLMMSNRKEVQQLFSEWAKIPVDELTIKGNFNLIYNVLSLVENKVGVALLIEGAIVNRTLDTMKFLPLDPPLKTNCVLVWKKRMHTPVVQEIIRRFKHAF